MSTAIAPQVETKPLTRKERSIAALYRRMQKAQARASTEYELADRLTFLIAKKLGARKTSRISSDGRGLQVIDNYQAAITHPKRAPEQMPKAWGHAAVRQYELKEVNLFVE